MAENPLWEITQGAGPPVLFGQIVHRQVLADPLGQAARARRHPAGGLYSAP